MSDLKPCPFCPDGGEPKIYRYSCELEYGAQVYCRRCGASGTNVHESMPLEDVEVLAIEAWNTRHERTGRTVLGKYGNYTCGVCGEVLLSGWADPFEAIPLECFKYCFNCGARVKEDTDAE